jgi:hypothetical protein
LLAYREDPSFFAVSRALGLHHQTVQRCVERACDSVTSPYRPMMWRLPDGCQLAKFECYSSGPAATGRRAVRWRQLSPVRTCRCIGSAPLWANKRHKRRAAELSS